jgi:hypothetical protein
MYWQIMDKIKHDSPLSCACTKDEANYHIHF